MWAINLKKLWMQDKKASKTSFKLLPHFSVFLNSTYKNFYSLPSPSFLTTHILLNIHIYTFARLIVQTKKIGMKF